jgi:glucose-1-phosphate cytidylyltransferase
MKVVLFCGGLGLRMRHGADDPLPKPLMPIGDRPILWHVMRYYAHFGHTDFVLCLGHGGDAIARYLRDDPDVQAWNITLADTGERASIGQRLALSRPHVADEDIFLANYADGLTDLHLPDLIAAFSASNKIGAFVCIKPPLSYHFVRTGTDGTVVEIAEGHEVDLRINGGFFVFRREIFDYILAGEDLVGGAFHRLSRAGRLLGYHHDGFWRTMDTFKDKQALDDLHAAGAPPWEIWRPTLRTEAT